MILNFLFAVWTTSASSLGNHLWQSTLFVVVAGLLTLALRQNQARARYWIWLSASVKFLIPFSLLVGIGSHLASTRGLTRVQPSVSFVMDEVSQPFVLSTTSVTVPGSVTAPAASTDHLNLAHLLPAMLLIVWLCGFIVVLFVWCARWRRISVALLAAIPLREGREVEALRRLEHIGVVQKRIQLLLSAASVEPGIFGIVRPVLVWPEQISERLTDVQLEAILVHEICHARLRDNLTAAIHMMVEAIFWFHPLVWWLGVRLVEERERACDEAVLQLCKQPHIYAESILKVCEFCVESPLACISGVTGSDLKKRIVRIMTERVARKLDFSRKFLLYVAGSVAVAVPVAIGAMSAPLSQAQPTSHVRAQLAPPSPDDIVGIWQGTLSAGGHDLRTEIKIANVAGGGYKTTLYSIDQGGSPTGATKTGFADGTLTFSIEALSVKYEGKMTTDGKAITGNWTDGPNSQPLVLTRTIPEAAWPIPEPPKSMAADASPGFDVVTIKPSKPGTPENEKRINFRGTHFIAFNVNMNDLVALAFGMHTEQILGAPDWFGTDRFDIDGKPDVDGQPSLHQIAEMTQELLRDRFALKFHHEQREIPVYIITVAGSGPKMDKTIVNSSNLQGFGTRGPGDLVVRNMDMAEFAMGMQTVMDKPVVDRTGLTDKYDFTLKWTPDDSQFAQFRSEGATASPGAGDNPNAPPSLYTAIQEQLGLKIKAGRTMDDVIVVDQVEKPSAN
jgi:uncharacterized protein (TIGR03435 family)